MIIDVLCVVGCFVVLALLWRLDEAEIDRELTENRNRREHRDG